MSNSTSSNSNVATTKQIEHLFWPPRHLLPATSNGNDRIDLLTYLDAEVYNTRGSYPLKLPYGVTVLRDRVVLEQERFSSPSRDHQTALASQFQASFAEQGFAVVVKEWANPTQKRSILRVRLKCRFAGCKFHFQINWDQNMGYWFISRRRCGIFQHSCRAHDGNLQADSVQCKRPVSDSPPPFCPPVNKRARQDPQEQPAGGDQEGHQPYLITPQINGNHSLRTVSCEQSPATSDQAASRPPKTGSNGDAAMDFAESLIELSKGKTGSEKDGKESAEQQREPTTKDKPEDIPREPAKQPHHQVVRPPTVHHDTRPRSIILGEIPNGTQAFAQMATTMGPNLFSHLVHGRGEMNLSMTFDGEGFVLRTVVPPVPPSMPHPVQPHQHHHPMDPNTRMPPLNYPYLPPRRYPTPARSDTAVVML